MRKEYFSIPNLMGYFRILLVPVYLIVYIQADSRYDYYIAALIMILSFLTDFLDGKVARRFNMVTEFGKILDPIADKITQGALAFSFTFRYPAMTVLLFVFLVKEGIMGITGALMMKRGYRMDGARMHGKVCTAVLDLVMFLVLIFPELPFLQVNILAGIAVVFMMISFVLYMNMYLHAWRTRMKGEQAEAEEIRSGQKKRKKRWIMFVVVMILAYIALGAILPFARQPEVSEETKEALNLDVFYGNETTDGERATVIADSGEALEERIRLISQAEEEIILSTFEFRADKSGKMVMAALSDAAKRGVKISILMDGVPCVTAVWGNPYFLALAKEDNIEIRVYNPVRPWKPWGLMGRLHDKYLIADDTAYILGGRNTYDYFLGDWKGYKNYDWDMLVYSGESAEKYSLRQLKEYFLSIWEMPECREFGKSFLWEMAPSVQKAGKELGEQIQTLKEEYVSWFEKRDYRQMTYPAAQIQLVSNPTHIRAKEPTVFYTITELMKHAEKEVVFHTPYIICNDWMLQRLQEVCEETEKVCMMTNSVANNGNPFGSMDYQKYKGEILKTGVNILEYDAGVSYHGKCFTIDERISAIGSFNWDMRSAYLDTELMLVVDSPEVNQQLREEMQKYEEKALKVVDEDSYDLPEDVTPQKISEKREFRIKVLKIFAGWARFLM